MPLRFAALFNEVIFALFFFFFEESITWELLFTRFSEEQWIPEQCLFQWLMMESAKGQKQSYSNPIAVLQQVGALVRAVISSIHVFLELNGFIKRLADWRKYIECCDLMSATFLEQRGSYPGKSLRTMF